MTADSPTAQKAAPRQPRLWPSKIHATILGLLLAGLVYIRLTDAFGDHAISNFLTVIVCFVCFVSLSIWFTFRSDYSATARYAWPGLVAAGLVLLSLTVKLVGFNGEMVPRFQFRWSQPADSLVGDFKAAPAETPLKMVVSPSDFHQFLGPNRNAALDAPRLSQDWKADKPEELWRIKIGAGWSPFSVAGDLAVTLEQRGQEEAVTCYSLKDGKMIWSHTTPVRHQTVMGGVGPRSAAMLHDGRVFALGAQGLLHCLDGGSGKVIWQLDLLEHYNVTPEQDIARIAWGRSNSPLIVDDMVVVAAGGAVDKPVSLIALNQDTGDVVWEGGETLSSYSSPVLATLAGVRQIVSVNEDNVSGHSPSTGEVLWTHEWPGHSNTDANCSQPQAIGANQILLTKGYSQGSEVIEISQEDDLWIVESVWENKKALKTKFTNVATFNHFAYGLSDGILECVDLKDGRSAWKRGRYGHGQVLLVGDTLLVQAEKGQVVMLAASPERHKELGKLRALDGQTWNNLCLAGDKLLVRNAQEAACYRLPLRK